MGLTPVSRGPSGRRPQIVACATTGPMAPGSSGDNCMLSNDERAQSDHSTVGDQGANKVPQCPTWPERDFARAKPQYSPPAAPELVERCRPEAMFDWRPPVPAQRQDPYRCHRAEHLSQVTSSWGSLWARAVHQSVGHDLGDVTVTLTPTHHVLPLKSCSPMSLGASSDRSSLVSRSRRGRPQRYSLDHPVIRREAAKGDHAQPSKT